MQGIQQKVMVWDPFVRIFHWSLVAAYAAAWATAEEWPWLHEQLGYFILILVGLRVVWGLIGTRHARFSDFMHTPRAAVGYLRSLVSGNPQHFVGHNPAGGWMIVALLLTLLAVAVSGLMVGAGEDIREDLHEGMANLSLLLVLVHVAGVLLGSLLHGENLVHSMITGRKSRRNVDVQS